MTGFIALGLNRTHDTLKLPMREQKGLKVISRLPLRMAIILDVILALSEGIPELDGSIARAGDNLSVVRAEAHRQHVGGVTNKAARGCTGVQIPETESVIPGR